MPIQENIDGKLYCKSCERRTNHGYLLKHTESHSQTEEWEVAFEDNYYITQCLGCDTIAFFREYSDEEMLDRDEHGNMYYFTDKFIYPEEPIKSVDKREPAHYPKEFLNASELIGELYNQVVSSFNLKHYLLCAVGLRMIVEAICIESNVSEGFLFDEHGNKKKDKEKLAVVRKNLEGKINGLYTKGIIVKKQALILHQIRELGNVTAHELEVPKRSTIRAGIEIIENMILNIFDLEKFQLK